MGLYEEAHAILKLINPSKLKATLPNFLEAALIANFPVAEINLV